MSQVVDDVVSLEKLTRRIADLEARVSALEQTSSAGSAQSVSANNIPRHPSPALGLADLGKNGNVITVIGKAVLAMAGAYLFRAIAESNPSAQFSMLFAAIVYSTAWMAWAVRAHRTNHFASGVYGTTATLILAPLLYESTTRFQLLSLSSTSAVFVAFVVLVLVLAWHSNLQVLPWVGTLASIITLWTLSFATHELVPLTCAMLAIALATEVAACLGHRLKLWEMVAITADAAVALFIYVMASGDGIPSPYPAASPTVTALLSLGLLGIYGGGIAIRSFGERKRISNFELFQGTLVFALAYVGTTRAIHSAASILGVLFLALSFVCYWGSLCRFAGDTNIRNRGISATWAVALMLAGTLIVFSPAIGTIVSCILAIAALSLHRRCPRLSLAVHSSFYLTFAAVLSPSLSYVREAFIGAIPKAPHWTVWTVLVSALLCYSLLPAGRETRWPRRLLWIPPALLVTTAIAALAVVVLHAIIARQFELSASHIAGIRTAVTCLVALTLAFIASRLERPELGWLAYTTVGLGALKLLLEDLRFGNAASLVVSLLFYGVILILLPRLLRPSDSRPISEERAASARNIS